MRLRKHADAHLPSRSIGARSIRRGGAGPIVLPKNISQRIGGPPHLVQYTSTRSRAGIGCRGCHTPVRHRVSPPSVAFPAAARSYGIIDNRPNRTRGLAHEFLDRAFDAHSWLTYSDEHYDEGMAAASTPRERGERSSAPFVARRERC